MSTWSEQPRCPRGPPQHFFPRARETRRRSFPQPEDKLSGGSAPLAQRVEMESPNCRKYCTGRANELIGGAAPSAQDSSLASRIDRRVFTQSAPNLRGTGVEVSGDNALALSTRRHFSRADHIKGSDLQVTLPGSPKPSGRNSGRKSVQATCHLNGAAVLSVTSAPSTSSRRKLAPVGHLSSGALVKVETKTRSIRVWPQPGTRVGELMVWDYGPGWKPSGKQLQQPLMRSESDAPLPTQSDGAENKRPDSAPCLASFDQASAQGRADSCLISAARAQPENDAAENDAETSVGRAQLESESVEHAVRSPAGPAQSEKDVGEKHVRLLEDAEIPACDTMALTDPVASTLPQSEEVSPAPLAHQCASGGAPAAAGHPLARTSRQDLRRPAAGLPIRRDSSRPSPFAAPREASKLEADERATIIRNALAEIVGLPLKPASTAGRPQIERQDSTPTTGIVGG